MPIDPNIALQTQPTQFQQFGFDNMLKTGDHMVGLQQDLLALRQNQTQVATQNALKGILSQPGAIDQNGMPTPEAMGQVTAVDPNLAMKLRQNMLATQENQQKLAFMKTQNFAQVNDEIYKRYVPLWKAYQEAKQTMPAEQAQKQFQDGLTAANADLKQGGFMTPEQYQRLPTKADPAQMEQYITGTDRWLAMKKAEADAGKAAQAANRERYPSEPKEMQYTGADGKPVTEQAVWDRDSKQWVSVNTHQPIAAADIREVKEHTLTDADRDINAIANERIAEEEKTTGAPLSEARKAAIRQQARIDPKVLEASQKQDANAITDDAARLIAEETLKGDWHATVGMGRNQASMKKIAEWRGKLAKEQGITGADLAANTAEFAGLMAGERLLGTRGTAIGLGIAEAQKFGPMVLELSDKIKRSDFPTFNSLQLAVAKGTGGEDVVRLVDSINAYKTAYAQVLSRGGVPTDDARRRSDEVLDKAWSNGQIRATIDQLGKEMAAAESAVPAVRNNLYRSVTGKDRPSEERGASPAVANAPAGQTDQGRPAIPQSAIDDLKANPKLASKFEQVFGPGSAQEYLKPAGQPAAQPATPAPATPAPAAAAPAQSNSAGGTRQNPIPVTTGEEAMRLPPGTYFIGPDKVLRRRPMTAATPSTVAKN